MEVPYYKELENPNRKLVLKLGVDPLDTVTIPDDSWVFEDNEEDSRKYNEPVDIYLPGIEYSLFKKETALSNQIPPGRASIIPASQLNKMNPYDRKKVINFLRKQAKGRDVREKDVEVDIRGGYFAPDGTLIDVIASPNSHKNNNMYYPYSRGMTLIGADDYLYESLPDWQRITSLRIDSKLDIASEEELKKGIEELTKNNSIYEIVNRQDYYDKYLPLSIFGHSNIIVPRSLFMEYQAEMNSISKLDEVISLRNSVYWRLMALKEKNTICSWDIVEFFNFVGSDRMRHILLEGEKYPGPAQDYSEEVRQNIIGLLSGHLAIYDTFIEIAKYVGNPGETINYIFRIMTDFFVQMVGFDKIESILPKTITSSRLNINETFYNYLINNWKVYQLKKYQVNKEFGVIERVDNDSQFNLINNSPTEREYAKEIRLIKEKVPLQERHRYLR